MTDLAVIKQLEQIVTGKLHQNEPMSRHTSWRIGGRADVLVEPAGIQELQAILEIVNQHQVPITLIGNGSNLLVKDGGIRGVVIKLARGMDYLQVKGPGITAGAGILLAKLAAAAAAAGIGGFEFAAGIPASLGGAVVMNAGANGSCIGDLLEKVRVLDYQGRLYWLTRDDLGFNYRTSVLQHQELVVVEVSLIGRLKEAAEIVDQTKAFLARRKATQPQGYPTAGSVFKNPPGDSAGRLIEQAGGKGLRLGDAEVSTRHANWILNKGNATARDVLTLIQQLQVMVMERFNVSLQPEVKVLGED